MTKNTLLYSLDWDSEGKFLSRPNRFVAEVEIAGKVELVHVHDSGRMLELLKPGFLVKLKKATNPNRKTKWDLITVTLESGEEVLVNSAYHRYISQNFLENSKLSIFGEVDSLKAEVKYGKSRIDYLLIKEGLEIWIEVKGVTLVSGKTAMFPDAPSVRATKHLEELIELKNSGKRAGVLLLILRPAKSFYPKEETDPLFSETFFKAIEQGVEIYPVNCELRGREIHYKKLLPIGR